MVFMAEPSWQSLHPESLPLPSLPQIRLHSPLFRPAPMTLVNAPFLGIERFANERNKENWSNATDNDKNTIIQIGRAHV